MNKTLKIIIPILVVLLLITGSLVWLYTGNISSAKGKIFSKVPLPAAIVGHEVIASTTYMNRLDLAKKLATDSNVSETDLNKAVIDQLVDNNKINAIAHNKNVTVDSKELDKQYDDIKTQFEAQGQDFEKNLQTTYGITPNEFKSEILKFSSLQSGLSMWFNGQEQLNSESYKTARDLLSKLESGANFEQVASQYTQDEASKNFAGDSGFIAYKDMLPEFQAAMKDVSINTPKIISSRYGLHIMMVTAINGDGDLNEKSYNIKQIFVKPADFGKWLDSEKNKIKSYQLI